MVSVEQLCFRFGEALILDDVNFTLQPRQKVALVGPNGAGKSTLLKLIAGELAPESGKIEYSKRLHLAVMEQEAPEGDQTVLQTVLMADTQRETLLKQLDNAKSEEIADIHLRLKTIEADSAPQRAAKILLGLGFTKEQLYSPCNDFSGGWRMRMGLARILFLAPDIMLLDEPTNHLDLEAVLWLMNWLKQYTGSLILISHDRDILNEVPTDILHLLDGKLRQYGGNFNKFLATRKLEQQYLQAKIKKQEKQRAHMQAFVDRFRSKESKAKQAQSRIKMLEKMEPIEQLVEPQGVEFNLPVPEQLAPPFYSGDNMGCGYQQDHLILNNMTFRLRMGMRIGLLGANGNGKTTFLRMLAGQIPYQTGEFTVSPKLRIGYFTQNQADTLPFDEDIISYIIQFNRDLSYQQCRDYLGRFGFGQSHIGRSIGSFSGGEKARLVLAKVFMDRPHLLLLDEVSNHLDIQSRESLVSALTDFEGAVILVSHDSWFLSVTTDEFWLIDDGKLKNFDGDLKSYEQWLMQQKNPEISKNEQPIDKTDKKEERRKRAENRALLQPLIKKIKTLETSINKHQKTIDQLQQELLDPEIYNDNSKVTEIQKQLGIHQKQLEEAEAWWLQYSEQLEQQKGD